MMDQDPPVPGPPSRASGRIATTVSAFSVPGYPIAWAAYAATVAGWSASMVVVGWIALELSDSSFVVGATYAARLLPSLFLGIPMGALADRLERRSALSIVNAVGAAALVLLAVRAVTGSLSLGELLLASVVLGIVDTFRGTLSQAYVVDLTGPDGATNALALSNLGAMLFGAVGAAVGGVVLDQSGPAAAFLVAAGGGAIAAGILLAGRRQVGTLPRGGPSVDARRAMTLLFRNRPVALVTLVTILGEVLGFASLTLFPTFARDVLHTDASGLGAMTAARSIGGIGGAIALASGARSRDGALLLLTTGVFGLALVAFAASSVFALSIGILVIVGGAMAALDTLGQTLVQRHVADHERGAAMGIWYFAIGFGPFGHLGLGAAAAIIGAPLTLAVSGGLLVASAAILTLTARTRHL
jgi:MFS family permease